MKWDVELVDEVVRVGRMHGKGPKGTVLFIPGRGDSLELREGVGRRIARHAAEVVMVELRGQGGSGRLGRHPDAVHIDDFEQHIHDIENAIRGLDELHLVAHSMGGLLGAHMLARKPHRFASAAISSPMWRFTQPLAVVRALAAAARAVGLRTNFAAGERSFDLATCVEMRTGSTGPSPDRELEHFAENHPDLVRGGSTWGWVAAAARCMSALDGAPLEQFSGRLVVGSCGADRTVSLSAHRRIAGRFPRGRVIDLDGGHDPFASEGAVRWWTAIERMLKGEPAWNC